MILLAADQLAKHFGPEPVLAGASFEIRPGEKVGLVGPNGAGKTTLLRIVCGQETADSGRVDRHPALRLGYLEQQPVFSPDSTLWQEASVGLAPLRELAHEAERLAAEIAHTSDPAQRARLGSRYDKLHHQLHLQDAYHLDHRVERVLHGLGFSEEDYHRPAVALSGGQQSRMLLARLLLAEADLMLLDEPSNHLDMAATGWLEDFLAESRAALLVVSHDRYFLDKVTNRTFELYRGTIDAYTGNFSAYWRQKAERQEVERRTFDRQQQYIAETEDFIRRNMAGQKTKQAKDRVKKLARLERAIAPREIAAPAMAFAEARRSGDVVLRVERLTKSFDRPVLSNVSLEIARGERWGIIGPNGSGKTTLLRLVVGSLAPDAGRVVLGAGVEPGYFDQLLSQIDLEQIVVDAVRPPRKETTEQERRDLLARFGMTGEQSFQPMSSLSGGERNRVALARLSACEANFLILDEPTNHLDLWGRDALERALSEFGGTLLLVSHDRFFLNRVVDHLLVIEPDRTRVVRGNYDAYRDGLAERAKSAEPVGEAAANRRPADAAATGRKRQFPYRKLSDLEREIGEHESRIARLHEMLSEPDTHRDGERVREALAEIDERQKALATLYPHWEEACELNPRE